MQPFHFWQHDVMLYAAKVGVNPDWMRTAEIVERLHRAYNAGELAWMVAEELIFVARERARIRRADEDHHFLIAMARGSV